MADLDRGFNLYRRSTDRGRRYRSAGFNRRPIYKYLTPLYRLLRNNFHRGRLLILLILIILLHLNILMYIINNNLFLINKFPPTSHMHNLSFQNIKHTLNFLFINMQSNFIILYRIITPINLPNIVLITIIYPIIIKLYQKLQTLLRIFQPLSIIFKKLLLLKIFFL